MHRLALAALLFSLPAVAEPPPFQADLSAWASRSGFKLSAFTNCWTEEEQYFGSLGSVCWTAKSTSAQKGSKDLFPRVRLVLSVYASEADAGARMKRFTETPKALQGEAGKGWPLRAGFRVGSRVMTVTTDAFAFERDTYAVAAALAAALKGTELTCWSGACPAVLSAQ